MTDPSAPLPADAWAAHDRLLRRVYLSARDGDVDPEDAFDLASWITDHERRPGPVVGELARAAADGAAPGRLAELSRHVLEHRFEPGFDLEPGWWPVLVAAVAPVQADLRATGLPGELQLAVPDWSPRPFVSYQGGHGSTSGIEPAVGRSELHAVLAVADEAQDAVMEVSWAVWPVCPAHQLGAHAREDHGAAAWGCNADGGHVIAPIGRWGSGPR